MEKREKRLEALSSPFFAAISGSIPPRLKSLASSVPPAGSVLAVFEYIEDNPRKGRGGAKSAGRLPWERSAAFLLSHWPFFMPLPILFSNRGCRGENFRGFL